MFLTNWMKLFYQDRAVDLPRELQKCVVLAIKDNTVSMLSIDSDSGTHSLVRLGTIDRPVESDDHPKTKALTDLGFAVKVFDTWQPAFEWVTENL